MYVFLLLYHFILLLTCTPNIPVMQFDARYSNFVYLGDLQVFKSHCSLSKHGIIQKAWYMRS